MHHAIERDRLRGRIWSLIRIGHTERTKRFSAEAENAALKREIETKSDALAGAQVFAIDLKQENETLKRAIRYEHTLGGGNECLKARQGIRCEICALLTAEEKP